jgi:nucleotide-binding universal stress UspA family protein
MWDSYGLSLATKDSTVSIHPCPVGLTASVEPARKSSFSVRVCDLETSALVDVLEINCRSNLVPVKTIVLAYDGSRPAEKALHLALSLTRSFKAKLHIVGVAVLTHTSGAADLQTIIERVRKRFSKKFYEIRLNAMNEGLQVETMLTLGDLVELTLGNAERFHAGLIVMEAPPGLEPTALFEIASARTARPVLVVTGVRRWSGPIDAGRSTEYRLRRILCRE